MYFAQFEVPTLQKNTKTQTKTKNPPTQTIKKKQEGITSAKMLVWVIFSQVPSWDARSPITASLLLNVSCFASVCPQGIPLMGPAAAQYK